MLLSPPRRTADFLGSHPFKWRADIESTLTASSKSTPARSLMRVAGKRAKPKAPTQATGPRQVHLHPVQEKIRQDEPEPAVRDPYPTPLKGFSLVALGPDRDPFDLPERGFAFTLSQFGVERVYFRRSSHLLEPATKNSDGPLPEDQDPLHCYEISEFQSLKPVEGVNGLEVTVIDQFGPHEITLARPAIFCDPSDVDVQ